MPPDRHGRCQTFADRREDLLRRFGMPTCAELRNILQEDAKLPDSAKLQYIKDYEVGLQDLCRQVTRETAMSGTKVVDGLLGVATMTLSQIRVGILAYGEQVMGQSGAATQTAMFEECTRAMRAGSDCDALWTLENELQRRVQQTPGWSTKVWDYVNKGMEVVKQGSQFVLKTAKDGVVMVFKGAMQLLQFFLPYIMKLVGYLFSSPRAAVLAFMYAKHMQKRICRYIARSYMLTGKPVPKETMASKLGNLGEYAKEYVSNVGLSQIASGLGSVVKETLLNHSDSLVNAAVGAVSLGFPMAAPLAMIVGGLVKGAIGVSADVMQDAAEYAAYQNDLDNAFSQLYEVLSFGDCVKAWRETTLLAGRINRYEENRSRIKDMDPMKYLETRSEEIFKTLPPTKEPKDEEIRRAYAKDMAQDEIKLHHELGDNRKTNAENWVPTL